MEIFTLEKIENNVELISKIKSCDWVAVNLLSELLEKHTFHDVLGAGELFLLNDEGNVVSFCTLTDIDCIDDKSLCPWVGFVYTSPEYRGKRYSQQIMKVAEGYAKKQGYKKVFLATDHVGFYEKYGYEFLEIRKDIYGEDSRVYFKNLIHK